MSKFNKTYIYRQNHQIYYEKYGKETNEPIFVIHGGPGGGFNVKKFLKIIPIAKYFVVFIHQRGCGKSLPRYELENNTTSHLIEDIEAIRKQLQLNKITLFGGSWGSTLSLLYAIKYPKHVNKLILRGVFLGRQEDIDYLYEKGASDFYPELHDKFKKFSLQGKGNSIIERYYDLFINKYDEEIKTLAFNEFAAWEDSLVSITGPKNNKKEKIDLAFNKQIALMETHYFVNNCFLPTDNYILDNLHKISKVNIDIFHGRQDIDTRPIGAWLIKQNHPRTNLFFIQGAGHSMYEDKIFKEIKAYFQK
ncbi:prolyl aminopeptidase [Mycoplasmopsis columboralis]|uniref:Proline iminopeptidase n=1 Tax=Mycoplasmopsis columboralis TaxID=171282 RepID=A0A449B6W5_9BACT|nr:prolyl aminopeptidase [Mycoplasmopsis columboralis]VEU76357.1 Proline iminopeptidase [Mycoplasmopsis columboralis]